MGWSFRLPSSLWTLLQISSVVKLHPIVSAPLLSQVPPESGVCEMCWLWENTSFICLCTRVLGPTSYSFFIICHLLFSSCSWPFVILPPLWEPLYRQHSQCLHRLVLIFFLHISYSFGSYDRERPTGYSISYSKPKLQSINNRLIKLNNQVICKMFIR